MNYGRAFDLLTVRGNFVSNEDSLQLKLTPVFGITNGDNQFAIALKTDDTVFAEVFESEKASCCFLSH